MSNIQKYYKLYALLAVFGMYLINENMRKNTFNNPNKSFGVDPLM